MTNTDILTKFSKAYEKLKALEYNNKPDLFLHQNKNEDFLTLGGCYEKWHQDKLNWDFVHSILRDCDMDMKRASRMLFYDIKTKAEVARFFKIQYWDKMKLDEIQSQKICNEIFLSGVHIGTTKAIKLAQKQIGVLSDGIIGSITIRALNAYNENRFDREFDLLEIDNYSKMGVFKMYKDGFISRAESV